MAEKRESLATLESLEEVFAAMKKLDELQKEAENDLNKLRVSNAKKLYEIQLEFLNRKKILFLEQSLQVFAYF